MLHPQRKQADHAGRNAVIAAVVVFLLVMLFVPRWRHATFCTVAGGRWTSKEILPYLEVGCRVKSRTAGQPCTGQLRNECDRSLCDLGRKSAAARGTTGGGTCPQYWIKNGYDKQGTFWNY